MAVISAGFVPVPAVDGGAGEVLTTEIINGNEKAGDYYMDIYTVESPKLDGISYRNAEIIQLHITLWNKIFCKFRNMFLKALGCRYRFIPYNRMLLKKFRDNYDIILVENNMQIYEDIYNHASNGKKNMIYHMHNDIDGTTKPEYLCKLIGDSAKTILPVSEYIKNHFYQVAPNDKMRVLYNCVDLSIFDYKINNKSYKDRYDISDKDFVYLYSGRICPEKGILELVKAFKAICKSHENVKLMIVGSRWYNQIAQDSYYKKLINESKGLENRIIFTGYVFPEKMPDIYACADCLVIPSLWEEPFGVVALEGMAMNKPIIATNSGGLIEILDSRTSYMIDKNKDVVNQLQLAMVKIKTDDDYKKSIIQNAYKKLINEKRFDSKEYYKNFKKNIEISQYGR